MVYQWESHHREIRKMEILMEASSSPKFLSGRLIVNSTKSQIQKWKFNGKIING
jgi:hypothetical protein